jgi:prepilin-type N-terminal cleavage/methylation domain-containing protein
MLKQTQTTNKRIPTSGFSLTETVITTAIIATVSSIAYPNYISSKDTAQCSEAQATLVSIPPIISAYIDATGEPPTTWENLSSIAAVMTSDGPATGDLFTHIMLPRTNYELSIEGPSNSTYLLTANCYVKTPISDIANVEEEALKDAERYKIRSCFNVSNGASDLRRGSGTDIANTPNCG